MSTDRRQDRRKKLADDFAVSLCPRDLNDGGPTMLGRAADLTMGGIGIVLAEEIDTALQSEVWAIEFHVPDKNGRQFAIRLNALITHGRPDDGGFFYGLKFTEIAGRNATAERAALRQFLLSDLREQWQGNPLFQLPTVAAR